MEMSGYHGANYVFGAVELLGHQDTKWANFSLQGIRKGVPNYFSEGLPSSVFVRGITAEGMNTKDNDGKKSWSTLH